MPKLENRESLDQLRASLQKTSETVGKQLISLCAGSGCGAYGTAKVHEALVQELAGHGLQDDVEVKLTGCHGFCEKGPIMVIHPEGIFYPQVKPKHMPEIVETTIKNGELVKSLIYKDPATKKKLTHEHEIPFYKLQQRIIFGNNGLIDPTSIEDYVAAGGYSALAKALFDMKPKGIIEEIKKSGPPGPRRRRVSNRHQVGDLRPAKGEPLCDLQCRRRRSGGLHGPESSWKATPTVCWRG